MVMKRYPHSAIILLAALALIGCSKAEEFQYNPDSALQIESVSGISPFALMQEPASKAVISGETLPSEEAGNGIGLFVTASNGGAYDGKTTGYSNVKYAFSNSKWSAASPIYLSNTSGKLYGYFPYSTAATDLKAIPVESSLNSTDYLYATEQGVSFSNKSVNLQMNHALARLHLTIKKGDKYLSDCSLTKIVLQSKAIDASGTMDITTGTVSATKAADATGTFELTGTDAVSEAGIEKDILLVPADNSEGKKDITLTLTIDGVDAEVKFTADKGLDIRSGIQCNATLTIEDTGIKVTGVGVGVWGDGGSQTVQADGHTVTVKLSDDAGIADDVLTNVKVDGNNVIILASSFQGRGLICNVGDNAKCERTITNCKFTFTISEISSNIEAVLGYAPPVTLMVTSDSNGKVWIGNDKSKTSGQFEIGQQVAIHTTPKDKFKFFIWNDNNRETSRTITLGEADVTYSASFISSDLISGLFTVNSDGKQVFFSKGNLYWDGSKYFFEDNQYTVYTKSGDETEHHIAHFYWSKSAGVAKSLSNYSDASTSSDVFFANNPEFMVNEHTGWSVLTGGEWKYLLDTRNQDNKFAKAKIHNMNGLLIFPDGYSLPSGYISDGGTGISKSNDKYAGFPSENIPDVTWFEMDAAGVVFLPAAGFRSGAPGDPNPAHVLSVGSNGSYWSASPIDVISAYDLNFGSGNVDPSHSDARDRAQSVRLVIESK